MDKHKNFPTQLLWKRDMSKIRVLCHRHLIRQCQKCNYFIIDVVPRAQSNSDSHFRVRTNLFIYINKIFVFVCTLKKKTKIIIK